VGIVIGAISVSGGLLFTTLPIKIPIFFVAIVIILLNLKLTGAMHFDALGDTVDGLFGGGDKKQRLKIMKDSNVGSFATVGITLAILAYFQILSSVLVNPYLTISVIILGAVGSRTTMAVVQAMTRNAKKTGLLSAIEQPKKWVKITQGLVALAICFATIFTITNLSASFIAIGIILFISLIARVFFISKLDGITGDCLGAIQIISEIILMFVFYTLIYNYPLEFILNTIQLFN
jgi:adenosylcobinamide-GDP ribazoletransferase